MRKIGGGVKSKRPEPPIKGWKSLLCLSREELECRMVTGVDTRKGEKAGPGFS